MLPLRIIAFAEGVSYLALFGITMPLKYLYAMPQPNQIVGLLHGILFILYIYLVLQAKVQYEWNWAKTGKALLASVIPFGTFWADKHLFRVA